jgi:hypothetical protein
MREEAHATAIDEAKVKQCSTLKVVSRQDTQDYSRGGSERDGRRSRIRWGGTLRMEAARRISSSHLFSALIVTSTPHVQCDARRSPVRPQCRAPTSPKASRQPRRPMCSNPTAPKCAEPITSGRTGQKERCSGRRLHSLQGTCVRLRCGTVGCGVRACDPPFPSPPPSTASKGRIYFQDRGDCPPRQGGQPVTLGTAAAAAAPDLVGCIKPPPGAISSPPHPPR